MSATESIRPASHEARGCGGPRRLSARWNRLALVVFLAALIGLLAWPSAAGAGPSRYVFEMCDSVLPGGGVDGVVYGAHPRPLFSSENTCSQPGGALVLRQNEINPGDGGETSWAIPVSPPPGGTLESVTITAAACGAPEASIWSLGWISPPGNWPSSNCGEDVRSFRLVNDFKAFFIELKCINWNPPPDSRCHAGPWIFAHYLAITVVDPVAPTLSELEGTLLADGVKRGRQGVGVKASDVGGGLSSLFVAVNGLQAAQPKTMDCADDEAHNPSIIGTVAAQPSPCPNLASANWTLDTGAYPFHDGANRVQLCASDFATLGDPNTSCAPTQSVNVDNSCTESPVAGGEVLSAQFSGSRDDTVTVAYGKAAEVSGQLANNAGDPIPGATLCLKMQTAGIGPKPLPVATVTTDASGHYAYQVPPGPNREIVVGYRHDSSQVARDVRYYAHAEPSLKVSESKVENGQRVRFRGQLPGPSNGSRVVVLQAGTVGSKRWITFRRSTANEKGSFKAAYRFTSTDQTTAYRFRAVVPDQAGYPWVEGHSKPVKVLVKP
jgi:hypothetical protein